MTPQTKIGIEATLNHMEAYTLEMGYKSTADELPKYLSDMVESINAIRSMISEPTPVFTDETIYDLSDMD